MTRLALIVVLLWPEQTEALSMRCEGRGPCSGSITFTGTIVESTTLDVRVGDGVLVVNWHTSGIDPPVSGERWAFYSADVMAVRLTIEPDGQLSGTAIGGLLAWSGDSTMMARR